MMTGTGHSNARFNPPSGSTLVGHEPICFEFDYEYSTPRCKLNARAKVENEESTHQGSFKQMKSDKRTIERDVHLNDPGRVDAIYISTLDSRTDVGVATRPEPATGGMYRYCRSPMLSR